MKKAIVILSLVMLGACAKKVYKISQADADRGSAKFPGLTIAELNHGKELYNEKCTLCHGAKNPTGWNEAQWRKIVPGMAAKANEGGKNVISATDQEVILKYVITMSTAKK